MNWKNYMKEHGVEEYEAWDAISDSIWNNAIDSAISLLEKWRGDEKPADIIRALKK